MKTKRLRIYNAYLTVTDNDRAKSIASSVVTAAGSCPISPAPDEDEDGEPNITDLCVDTPLGLEVDSSGCSLVQFCAAIDISQDHGRQICNRSDWKNDEPLENKGDCVAIKEEGGPSNYLCVPR